MESRHRASLEALRGDRVTPHIGPVVVNPLQAFALGVGGSFEYRGESAPHDPAAGLILGVDSMGVPTSMFGEEGKIFATPQPTLVVRAALHVATGVCGARADP